MKKFEILQKHDTERNMKSWKTAPTGVLNWGVHKTRQFVKDTTSATCNKGTGKQAAFSSWCALTTSQTLWNPL